jgi:hypothetical protein
MKVTKKVGRCSRKYTSSVSRRRFRSKKNSKNKSSYKKKYAKTQKGGKRGRGEKRVRASTHKRVKRFHKGGEQINCSNFTETNGNYELTIQNQTLFVKKNGELVQGGPTQQFNIKLSVKTGTQFIKDMSTSTPQSSTPRQFVVTFERTTKGKDGKNVSFNISDLSYFTEPTKQKQKQTQRYGVSNETYDFSDTKNDDFFKEIEQCIKTQLKKQKEELKAYYTEVKDLLEHCKIVILSSVEKQILNVVPKNVDSYNSGFNDWGALLVTPKPPFFSFLFFVYVDEYGNIDTNKTKKLVELLSLLSNYGLFYVKNAYGQPYSEKESPLKKLQDLIKTGDTSILKKIYDSVTKCNSLLSILSSPDSLTITTDMVNLVKPIEDLRNNGIGTGTSISPQSLRIAPNKVWEVFTKIKNSPNSDSLIDLTNTEGLTLEKLISYIDSNNDFLPENLADDAQRSVFKEDYLAELKSQSKPSDIQIEREKIQNREFEVDNVIRQLGENIEAHPNDTNSKVRSYSQFKAEQESKAAELKKQIDDLPINEDEKEKRKANVDFYLKKILETQLDYMKRRYRAFYIYQDFTRPDESSNAALTTNESGLYDKDKDYEHFNNVFEVLNILQDNVEAFQFRMEKQADNPVSDEYSDLVSTLSDEANYESLFQGCKTLTENDSGNASKCYKSLKKTPTIERN